MKASNNDRLSERIKSILPERSSQRRRSHEFVAAKVFSRLSREELARIWEGILAEAVSDSARALVEGSWHALSQLPRSTLVLHLACWVSRCHPGADWYSLFVAAKELVLAHSAGAPLGTPEERRAHAEELARMAGLIPSNGF